MNVERETTRLGSSGWTVYWGHKRNQQPPTQRFSPANDALRKRGAEQEHIKQYLCTELRSLGWATSSTFGWSVLAEQQPKGWLCQMRGSRIFVKQTKLTAESSNWICLIIAIFIRTTQGYVCPVFVDRPSERTTCTASELNSAAPPTRVAFPDFAPCLNRILPTEDLIKLILAARPNSNGG